MQKGPAVSRPRGKKGGLCYWIRCDWEVKLEIFPARITPPAARRGTITILLCHILFDF